MGHAVKFEDVARIAGELTALRFFPGDSEGRLGIMKLIGRMATNEEQVRWLVRRTMDLFDEWPGPRTLRLIFCKRFKPADGIDICGTCEHYPDGIPSEKRLEAPILALPSGVKASADPKMESAVRKLAQAKSMPRPLSRLK